MTAKPDTERVILLVCGESGTGKSFFVANLKKALIFDTDIGGGLSYLDRRIEANESERVEVGSWPEVMEQLQRRKRELERFSILSLDHLTNLTQESVLRNNPSGGEDFGKSYDKAAREWRKFREFARRGDYALVCTSHLKNKYEGAAGARKIVGLSADTSKNIEADFMQVLHLARVGKYPALAHVIKWRRDPEDGRGAVPVSFPFAVDQFAMIHGRPIDAPRSAVPMASPEQVREIEGLAQAIKLDEGTVEAWFAKAKADSWEEFTAEAIAKCIKHLKDKLPKK